MLAIAYPPHGDLATNSKDRIALILGTGWSAQDVLKEQGFKLEHKISFSSCGIKIGGENGHPNQFLLGTWHGKDVVISQGRVHLYQETGKGHDSILRRWMSCLLALMGRGTRIVIACAVGGVAEDVEEDMFCMPTAIKSAHVHQPHLIGNLGEFVMSEHLLWTYKPEFEIDRRSHVGLFHRIGQQLQIKTKLNTAHVMVPGPGFGGSFERAIWASEGIHTVGMSLDPELRLIALENSDNRREDDQENALEDKVVFPILFVSDAHDLPDAEEIKARSKAMAPTFGKFLSMVLQADWKK